MRRVHAALVVLALVGVGCGGSAADKAHRTLSGLTEVSDPLYSGAVRACHAQEQAVVDRVGSTPEEDQAAIAEIRATCNRIFGAFELLIKAQVDARKAIDGFEAGTKTAEHVEVALQAVSDAWAIVKAILEETGVL